MAGVLTSISPSRSRPAWILLLVAIGASPGCTGLSQRVWHRSHSTVPQEWGSDRPDRGRSPSQPAAPGPASGGVRRVGLADERASRPPQVASLSEASPDPSQSTIPAGPQRDDDRRTGSSMPDRDRRVSGSDPP